MAPFTPADLFHGRVAQVAAIRQQALTEHYAHYPQRYVNGAPTIGTLRIVPTPVDTVLPEVVT